VPIRKVLEIRGFLYDKEPTRANSVIAEAGPYRVRGPAPLPRLSANCLIYQGILLKLG
jgi:hypothetical protein